MTCSIFSRCFAAPADERSDADEACGWSTPCADLCDAAGLIAAILEQEGPVPVVFRSYALPASAAAATCSSQHLLQDGSAAVLFSVADGGLGGGGTATATGGNSVCRRRSTEVVMVEAAGGGHMRTSCPSLSLVGTLLAEALARGPGSGLCIADCNAYVQAEQLTASSRAASRLQDLESLRFLERVGKGGYGSVYRGLYHGAEVAIKVIEDPAAATLNSTPSAAPKQAAAAAAALVASVSFNHPNIVQLITYFVDVRAHVSPDCDDAANTNINANNNPPPGSAVASPGPNARTPQGIYVGADGRVSRAANGQAGAPPPPQDLEYVEDCVDLDLEAEQVDNTYLDGGDGGDVDQVAEVEDLVGDYEDEYGDEYGDDGGGEYGGGAPPLVPRPPVQLARRSRAAMRPLFWSWWVEFCDRGSLKEAITQGAFLLLVPFNMKAVYSTLLEISLALRHMHGLHMVHCDLKPQNVLLKSSPRDPRGFTAKLSDFGLAKMMAHDENGELAIDESIQSGVLVRHLHVADGLYQAQSPPPPHVLATASGCGGTGTPPRLSPGLSVAAPSVSFPTAAVGGPVGAGSRFPLRTIPPAPVTGAPAEEIHGGSRVCHTCASWNLLRLLHFIPALFQVREKGQPFSRRGFVTALRGRWRQVGWRYWSVMRSCAIFCMGALSVVLV
eukprot:XP_001700368.1 predicted protein [Chlamydomonas reinhardtii]